MSNIFLLSSKRAGKMCSKLSQKAISYTCASSFFEKLRYKQGAGNNKNYLCVIEKLHVWLERKAEFNVKLA